MKNPKPTAAGIGRKSDGRRIFTDQFRREQIGRVLRGELTLAELSRELGIARSLLQRWKRLASSVSDVTRVVRGRTPPITRLATLQYIRELQVLLGKQTVELAFCRTQVESLTKGRRRTREGL